MILTLGGSVVILIPAWRIEMGKPGWGALLNQSRKSGWGSFVCKRAIPCCGCNNPGHIKAVLAIHIWLFWTGSESPTYWWLDRVTKFTVGVIQTFPQLHSSGGKFGKEPSEVNQFEEITN